jgi:hypothetical protein
MKPPSFILLIISVIAINACSPTLSPSGNVMSPDPNLLTTFHHVSVFFIGAHVYSSNGGCPSREVSCTGKLAYAVGDSIVFTDSIVVQNGVAVGPTLVAFFSSDAKACDSLRCSSVLSCVGCIPDCPYPYDKSYLTGATYNGNSSISISNLPLVLFSQDSVVYELTGPSCEKNVECSYNTAYEYCNCARGCMSSRGYGKTSWLATPTPALRVVFTK